MTNCCPPSMSYVAPVTAVSIMRCTASAADRREVEGEAGDERGHAGGDRRDDLESGLYPPTGAAADEYQRPGWSNSSAGAASNREGEQHVPTERITRFFSVHLEGGL
ncbi:MAG TPA: hypothetical protein VEF89_14540 [Solirubrobacteraceae bacterium]|nr:hypothetical protein [Solirubrobacteraceae bacterium]